MTKMYATILCYSLVMGYLMFDTLLRKNVRLKSFFMITFSGLVDWRRWIKKALGLLEKLNNQLDKSYIIKI